MNTGFLGHAVATVLTVYGIETVSFSLLVDSLGSRVATVLTVYGIETCLILANFFLKSASLQQYLPFTVLKLPPYFI